jgi:hypothetical protein
MPQRFQFDRRSALPYLVILALACGPRAPGSLVPVGAAPVDRAQVEAWAAGSSAKGHQLHRFRWQLQDERGAAGGRGTARLAAPDSVRLDVSGPLGSGRGSAVVVGDSALWTDPEDVIERLVPSFPLMWAMFGMMRLPPDGAALRGLSDSSVTVWEAASGADTVAWVRQRAPSRLLAEVRAAGKVVGRVETELAPDGRPLSSRLTVPSVPARLDLTFTSSTASEPFPGSLWRPGTP